MRHHAPRAVRPPAPVTSPERPATRPTTRRDDSAPRPPHRIQCSHTAPDSERTPSGPTHGQLRLTARLRPAAGSVTARPRRSAGYAPPRLRLNDTSPHVVPCLYVGAAVQQQPHSRLVAVLRSHHDRRPAVLQSHQAATKHAHQPQSPPRPSQHISFSSQRPPCHADTQRPASQHAQQTRQTSNSSTARAEAGRRHGCQPSPPSHPQLPHTAPASEPSTHSSPSHKLRQHARRRPATCAHHLA